MTAPDLTAMPTECPPTSVCALPGGLTLLRGLATPCWIFDVDQFSIIWANDSALRVWQADSLEELCDRDCASAVSAAVVRRLQEYREGVEMGKISSEIWTIHPRTTHPRDKPLTFDMHYHGITLADSRTAMLIEAIAETKLGDSETVRSMQALLHTPAMVSMYYKTGELIYCNPAARDMLGPAADKLTDHFRDQNDMDMILKTLEAQPEFSTECRVLTSKGEAWHQLSIQRSCDNLTGRDILLVSEINITQRRNTEQRVQSLAYSDPLTGLPNRTYFNEKIGDYLNAAAKYQTQLALLFIDLDRFKLVNDSLGHGIGDGLLNNAARVLQSALRRSDTLVRLGGDEFVVVMHHLPEPSAAEALAIRLLDCMKDPVTIHGHELRLSASIGIAVYPDDGSDSANLMKNADLAMYQAKDHGGNCMQRFNPLMGVDLSNRLQMEVDLKRAIGRDEFELYYQPRICSKSGKTIGAEALVRWNHPERGLVNPGEFIPLAEETGQIVDIGNWVLDEAVRVCARWHQQGLDLTVSVNISSRQLDYENFTSRVLNTLTKAGCPTHRLELELTESMLVSKTSTVLETLNALQDTGIQIAIDDFGTGYSNLCYLKDFPIDKLKIDRSFVMDKGQRALVEMIVALGRLLKVKLVAEGIETEEQCTWLKSLQCDEFQGYLFSRPLPRREFERFLNRSREESGAGCQPDLSIADTV